MPIFAPKLISTLKEGYSAKNFRSDAIAGLTVAIVALPLSLAIAIASHAPPQAGLFAAIFGGFLVSALGGSRFQVGGPAAAFIVLIASIIDTKGLDGLFLATIMAGVMLALAGTLKLGTWIKRVPHEVIVGFTSGIGLIILASQIKDFLGLRFEGTEPSHFAEKLSFLYSALPSLNLAAVVLSATTVLVIWLIRRWLPRWPGLLMAVLLATAATHLFNLPVETIGNRFGEIPRGLPLPHLPPITISRLVELFPSALSLAALGAIESLLSAMVADKMSKRSHRPNTELVAQGIANIVAPLFGAITVTGTIARTATNIRAQAHGPVSGMLHAAYLAFFLLVGASLLKHIPLAALAGVLTVVALGMLEWREFVNAKPKKILVMLATLIITVQVDLIAGLAAGVILQLLFQMKNAEAPRH